MINLNEILYLTWRCTEDTFKIGELIFCENRYYFKYDIEGVKEATKHGFELLNGFSRLNSKYFSEVPFKLFSSWISTNHKQEIVNFNSFKNLKYGSFSFVNE